MRDVPDACNGSELRAICVRTGPGRVVPLILHQRTPVGNDVYIRSLSTFVRCPYTIFFGNKTTTTTKQCVRHPFEKRGSIVCNRNL